MSKAIIVGVAGLMTVNAQAQVPALGKSSVKAVVKAMTLEEKVKLVVGTGGDFPDLTGVKKNETAVPAMSAVDLVPGAAGTSYVVPRLGITPMVLTDGPAGLRIQPQRPNDSKTFYCTAFPVATLLASTWDTELVKEVGIAMGNEVHEYGSDVLLAPAINIHRNPLCGRNFEYYSEDPMLAGTIAAAMINGVQSQGVGTSLKHFAANNSEDSRNSLNTIVSQRALREIYLEGFRIAVEQAQPWTVMSSYNIINGTYTSEDYNLLTKILRNEWGFKGFVMTDWYGGKDCIAQMKAGNDMIMPGRPKQATEMIDAVNSGKLDIKVLDKNVERILTVMLNSPHFKGYKYSDKPDLAAHATVARAAATEGIILLKNTSNALPLASTVKKVAAFGNASYDTFSGGTGSGDVNEAYTVSISQGLSNSGYDLEMTLKAQYENYINDAKSKKQKPADPIAALLDPNTGETEMGVEMLSAKLLADECDAAIITIGRNAGEGNDRKNVEGDFKLTQTELSMVARVSTAFRKVGKKVIVVLNIGGVIEVASWRDLADAIVLAWQGGQETGNSIADIITGKVNPSGKLTSTFPMKYEDVPSAGNFPGRATGKAPEMPKGVDLGWIAGFLFPTPTEIIYEEGIYVGYRYYGTFGVKPAYEFGFGLSYTKFEYSGLKLASPDFKGKQTVSVTVKNTGAVAGREVVQLYVSAPASKIDKPKSELKGFAKTKLLQPGESQTLTLALTARDLSSFNTEASAWIADAGKYEVLIGASSSDIKLSGAFNLKKAVVTEKVNNVMAPQVAIKELVKK
ncbi:MAG: glycoside hydrolase family 3 N-terminal domain-containing protein [Bacteroidales bacterium]|nr:glycoside hydrolase family 3 N-terminal domain-containing protein [Bacteroidales bacterium]